MDRFDFVFWGTWKMMALNKVLAAVTIAASAIAFTATPANASLTTTISGGFGSVSSGQVLNTFNVLTVFPNTGGFINTSFVGQGMLSGGSLWESGLTSSGVSSYSVVFTETGINLSGSALFASLFNTNNIGGGVTVSRQLFFDPTNAGLQSILLTSSNVSSFGSVSLQSAAQLISGPFSLTEVIQVSGATSPGSSVSLDDTVHVPEPGAIAIMIGALLSILGLGTLRRGAGA